MVVAEGEKDVDNLARIGVLATCNAGGAGKWTAEHAKYLTGRHVVVVPDNEPTGRNHGEQVALTLHGLAAAVRIVELPGLPPKGDASDWIAAGGTKEELRRLAGATPNWTPAAAVQPWPEIESFDQLNLPDFPTHALPGVLRNWVEAESHDTQTPPDLAGLLSVAVCAATIARRVEVEPRPGWREPVNLFAAVLLEPGNRKSAVFADAMRPLRELEVELIEAARANVAREQSDRRQSEARLRKLEKLAAEKGDAEARHESGNLAAELAERPEPVLPRLIVDDATSEKLGIMLAEQGGRVASMSPEGGVFDLMAGLYSKSGIPQFGVYLMGHSGDDLIVDRVSRKSVRVERPALTCAYAMQPQVIARLAENVAFRGRGLLARFLYAAPRSWIGEREIAAEPVPPEIREAYRNAVKSLADSVSGNIENGLACLRLTPQAGETLHHFETFVQESLGDGGSMERIRDWGAKLCGATLRIAATIHCVERGLRGLIDDATIRAAVAIGEYLIPHAEAVLNMMQASDKTDDDNARYVLRWIVRHGRREFTKREAHQHGKRRFPNPSEAYLPVRFNNLARRADSQRAICPAGLRSARTVQAHLTAIKGFTKWLAEHGKLPNDPLASIKRPDPKSARKRPRRMLLLMEWEWLRSVTLVEGVERLGMEAGERVLLYATAIQTGLRSGVLRSLTRGRLYLDAAPPYVTCKAGSTKNRKDARQYIQEALAVELRDHVSRKAPKAPVFDMPSKHDVAGMLRADLDAARREWRKAAERDPEERLRREQSDFLVAVNHDGQALDFHGLRHTCGAWLAMSGAHPKAVQAVMRHSTITLTMDTYGHLFPGQEAETVARLPDMLGDGPEALRATGTCSATAGEPTNGSAVGAAVTRRKMPDLAGQGETTPPQNAARADSRGNPQVLRLSRHEKSRRVMATAGLKAEGKGLEPSTGKPAPDFESGC